MACLLHLTMHCWLGQTPCLKDVAQNLCVTAAAAPPVPAESEKGARIYSLRRVVASNTEYYAYGEAAADLRTTMHCLFNNALPV